MSETATPPPIHVLGFAGSLRKASYNRSLLRAALNLLPPGMTLEEFDLAPIPLYNGDVEAEGIPAPVQQFRDRLAAADAVLIATPEYNASIPGVLKNAIDWASRGPASPLQDKPVALMGATPGGLGTALSQSHVRQALVHNNMHPLSRPQVFVARAHEKFDAEGKLVDEPSQQFVRELLEALLAWTRRIGTA
jgi:chromate reductase